MNLCTPLQVQACTPPQVQARPFLVPAAEIKCAAPLIYPLIEKKQQSRCRDDSQSMHGRSLTRGRFSVRTTKRQDASSQTGNVESREGHVIDDACNDSASALPSEVGSRVRHEPPNLSGLNHSDDETQARSGKVLVSARVRLKRISKWG